MRAEEDVIGEVLGDASTKIRLFIGNTVRCKVKITFIGDVYEQILHSQAVTFGVLTMDYKMKFEPKKYRQKSSDRYGRKGLSWHGPVVTFKVRQDETEKYSPNVNESN